MQCRFFSLRGWLVDELDESVVYAHPCMHRIDGLARRGAPPFRHQYIMRFPLFFFVSPKVSYLAPAIVHMAEHIKKVRSFLHGVPSSVLGTIPHAR